MPIKVYVYSHDAYNEYTLSNENDECVTIELLGEFYGVCSNIEVVFERNNGEWTFAPNSQYVIYKEEVPYTDGVLSCGCIYKIITTSREYIYLYGVEVSDTTDMYDKYDISNISKISIGALEKNTIMFQNLNLVSRVHATMEKFHNGIILDDLSCNGVFVNNKRINGRTYLTFGSRIFMFGLEMIYLGNVLAIHVSTCDECRLSNALIKYYEQMPVVCNDKENVKAEVMYYNRSPRGNVNDEKSRIKIMCKPNIDLTIDTDKYLTSSKDNVMFVCMVLGIGAMFGAFYKGLTKVTASIAVVMVGILFIYLALKVLEKNRINKMIKLNNEREKRSTRLYERYLGEQEKIICEKNNKYREYMLDRYKSADEYSEYDFSSTRLWNRNVNHDDFLRVRVGLGSVFSNLQVDIPDKSEYKEDVALYRKARALKNKYRVMKDMPICIDLQQERVIGIVSEDKKGAKDLANVLVTGLAANVCYSDVKLAFVFDEKEENYDIYKWLPHIWSEEGDRRFIANNEESAKELLNELYKRIVSQTNVSAADNSHVVLFVSKVSFLMKEPFFRLLQEKDKYQGFSVILTSRYCRQLPNVCELILQNDDKFRGILNVKTQRRTRINFDCVEEGKVIDFVRRLAPIKVPEVVTGEVVMDKCTLLETFGVKTVKDLNIEKRWKENNSYEGLNIPIGLNKKNEVFNLNVHEKYFGPHGLVAGTTGSGKSELIKSFITSLAINYSPEEVNFVVIDYKGGIMGYELSDIPHVVGNINNLSKEIVDRALVTLKGEVDRRQKMLATYGLNNIDMLIKLNKCGEIPVKVPYLFIIVDEFARLKEKEPEFIKELIGISQLGRSLGINLLLATQKPSGNVDDNIWSNSKYRICLKVLDEQDSYDVLHNTVASKITNVGGAYIQVGNDEIFEEIQTVYTGEIYDERIIEKKPCAELIEYNGKVNDFKLGKIIKKKEQLRFLFIEKLIYLLINVNKKINIIYSSDLNEEDFELVINKLYDKLAEENIEYERTSLNSKKLCNFVGLFILVDKSEFKTIHEQAVEIIRKADDEDILLPMTEYKTELSAITKEISDIAKDKYKMQPFILDELHTKINHNELVSKPFMNRYEALVGVYDDPYGKKQENFYINMVEDGHTIVYGGIMSGKSTFLQTVVYDVIDRYDSEEVAIYGIDFNSGAMKVFRDADMMKMLYLDGKNYDCDSVEDILEEIQKIIDSRKEDNLGGDIIQSWKDNKTKEQMIMVVIDDIVKLCRYKTARYESKIMDILKDGMSVGVYVLASASGLGASAVTSRLASVFKTSICMQLRDKYEYMQCLHYVGEMVMPKANIPGRGVALINNKVLEFQVALPYGEANDAKRSEIIKDHINGKVKLKPVVNAELITKPILAKKGKKDDEKTDLKEVKQTDTKQKKSKLKESKSSLTENIQDDSKETDVLKTNQSTSKESSKGIAKGTAKDKAKGLIDAAIEVSKENSNNTDIVINDSVEANVEPKEKDLNIKRIKVVEVSNLPKITWTTHKNNKVVKQMLKENKLPLGENIKDNKMHCVNLDDTFVYKVAGAASTGKTGIMKVLISLASVNKKDKVYVVDFTKQLYATVAQRLKVNYVTTMQEFNAMMEDLAEEFKARKDSPREEKIYIFGDMERFIKAIYKPLKSGLDAKAFMENVSEKGSGYNIYFIMETELDSNRKLKGYEVYNNFMDYNTGICTSECELDFEQAQDINIPIIRG
ncbi:MAG: FHA domain-containing protein [Lachnospiraceae bacterium]|nr:FHA domain-containing protein [Lachnospiraceae bacterium]